MSHWKTEYLSKIKGLRSTPVNSENCLKGVDTDHAGFFSFMKRYRKEVFLYLEGPVVKKTSDIA